MLSKFKNSEKNISIDYITNKISLSGICGNLTIQSDIDPELVVRIANTNLKLEQIHPDLMDPEAINKILNSDSVKNSIIKHMIPSTKVMEVKNISTKPSNLDSSGGNIDVGVTFKHQEK
jgi:hypothetical protein